MMVSKILASGLDPQLLTKVILPDCEWAKRIFQPEVVGTVDRLSMVTTTHYGCCEARIVLQGEEVLLGTPYDKIPGGDLRDKRRNLCMMSIDGLTKLLETTGGFVMSLSSTLESVVVVPSGFVIITASEGCSYLRWAVAGDQQDSARVRFMLGEMMAAMPEVRSSAMGYVDLCTLLDNTSD